MCEYVSAQGCVFSLAVRSGCAQMECDIPRHAVPIQLEAFRCASHLVDLFKADMVVYLRQHGMKPVWSDMEEAREQGTACAVVLYKPAERVSSAEVIRCLQQRPATSGAILPA